MRSKINSGGITREPVILVVEASGWMLIIPIERGVRVVGHRSLIHRLLVVRLARQRWPQIDDFTCVFVDQEDVLVGMRLLVVRENSNEHLK